MIGSVLLHILRFALLMLLQVLVLDHLDLANGYMVPYLYVLFLLMLPFELPAWLTLLIGAFTGLVMDLFSSTPGMHMSACLVMVYGRIHLLRLLAPREGYEFGMQPSVPSMGIAWFLTYAGVLILLHHIWLFYVELLRFDRFFGTFLRAVLSASFTLVLVLLTQFITALPDRVRS
mgnify:CR=1 FL=1